MLDSKSYTIQYKSDYYMTLLNTGMKSTLNKYLSIYYLIIALGELI